MLVFVVLRLLSPSCSIPRVVSCERCFFHPSICDECSMIALPLSVCSFALQRWALRLFDVWRVMFVFEILWLLSPSWLNRLVVVSCEWDQTWEWRFFILYICDDCPMIACRVSRCVVRYCMVANPKQIENLFWFSTQNWMVFVVRLFFRSDFQSPYCYTRGSLNLAYVHSNSNPNSSLPLRPSTLDTLSISSGRAVCETHRICSRLFCSVDSLEN